MERNGKATKEAEWVARLRELTTKTKESIFASGDVLIEMKSDLTKKRFKELIKQVPISIGHANNLMRVASRKFLRDPDIEPYLPPVIGTLIDLAAPKQWQDESIRRCIADGVMRPDVERNGLDEWIESQAVPADIDLIELTKTSIPRDNAEPSLLCFLNHDDWTQDEVNELIELLATTTSQEVRQANQLHTIARDRPQIEPERGEGPKTIAIYIEPKFG